MRKIIFIAECIWAFTMIVTGLWAIIALLRLLIGTIYDKIEFWKYKRKLKKLQKEKQEKMNVSDDWVETMKENREPVDIIIEDLKKC